MNKSVGVVTWAKSRRMIRELGTISTGFGGSIPLTDWLRQENLLVTNLLNMSTKSSAYICRIINWNEYHQIMNVCEIDLYEQ